MVRARRKADLKPWIGTKISATIMDFGQPLIEQMVPDESPEVIEHTLGLVIAIWNAHVMAQIWGQPHFLGAMREKFVESAHEIPQALEPFEALSARRQHEQFVNDPRAVGEWSIRHTAQGQWSLRCDARLPSSMPADPAPTA